MYNSIEYFKTNSIKNFEKLNDNFMANPTHMMEYVTGITEEVHKLGIQLIQEQLEMMDKTICKNGSRKYRWVVDSRTSKQLTTSLGTVVFEKTLFKNKETGEREYLIDRLLEFEPKQRLTEDAVVKMLSEAVDTSYQKAGEETSIESQVSKQTVKNKIHQLKFPEYKKPLEKKVVDYLYIDADEDHVSLQYKDVKGDLRKNARGRKNNCLFTKLVYVYEGIEPEGPKSKRNKLINKRYFCSVSQTQSNSDFWDEIYKYMDDHYDLSQVKQIYLNSDGGGWIKEGVKRLKGVQHVLDEFHLKKYMTKLVGHLKDSQEEARNELYYTLRHKNKKEFQDIIAKLQACTSSESVHRRIDESSIYILNNWTASKLRLQRKAGVVGSSTEGHVSHVLASRMSSRPMGWSVTGGDKMSRLRAYHLNGGNMLELVRYQKQELPKAVGDSYDFLTVRQLYAGEHNRHGDLGKYSNSISHSLSTTSRGVIKFYKLINRL